MDGQRVNRDYTPHPRASLIVLWPPVTKYPLNCQHTCLESWGSVQPR